jgi:hypothetical protein
LFRTDNDEATDGERDGDLLAAKEVSQLVAELSTAAKVVRDEIREIERLAPLVTDSERRQEARMKIVQLRWKLYEIVAAATHGRYTPLEVKEWIEHAVHKGKTFPLLNVSVIGDLAKVDRVPNAALREGVLDLLTDTRGEYEALIKNAHERLVELEVEDGNHYGSSAWRIDSDGKSSNIVLEFRRNLGIEAKVNGRGESKCSFLIPYHKAVAISHAIGMHPQQAGV